MTSYEHVLVSRMLIRMLVEYNLPTMHLARRQRKRKRVPNGLGPGLDRKNHVPLFLDVSENFLWKILLSSVFQNVVKVQDFIFTTMEIFFLRRKEDCGKNTEENSRFKVMSAL